MYRLPIQKILDKIPLAHERLGATHEHWMAAAQAICTTDTFPKLVSRTFNLPSQPGIEYKIAGMTKGAGMIHPNMATLLGMIFTDAPIPAEHIKPLLKSAVDVSFNSISIDGDTSTNDTVALLANGAAGGGTNMTFDREGDDYLSFKQVLSDVAKDLAQLVVRDGEGATKFITIQINGALTESSGHQIASSIARSPLVKTALYGKDANWGRILCAIGYSSISPQKIENREVEEIEPSRVSLSLIPADGSEALKLLVDGEPEVLDETRAAEILEHEDVNILVNLNKGDKSVTYWTCDYR
jgi:glutamate N-acetyltransferase/amino-acid N-acetyltransferase